MSDQPKIDLAGFNIKEWSLIILIFAIAMVFVVFAIGMAVAMTAGQATITFTGDIDLGQFTGVIIGIAMVAVVLISQQLTAKSQAAAVAATDQVWMAEK